jgi:hypothetical protein
VRSNPVRKQRDVENTSDKEGEQLTTLIPFKAQWLLHIPSALT